MTGEPISTTVFIKRLTDLCTKSGMSDFPKGIQEQHILLKSAAVMLEPGRVYTEKEINEILERWVTEVSGIKFMDRVTMRRQMVDTGYLERSNDGASYRVVRAGSGMVSFDPGVDDLDPVQVILNARQEKEQRKREYQDRANRSS